MAKGRRPITRTTEPKKWAMKAPPKQAPAARGSSSRPMIAKGGAGSSNPTQNKFRLAARNIRLAKLAPMIAVDEAADGGGIPGGGLEEVVNQLSMSSMGLNERGSIISLQESAITRATTKELENAPSEFHVHVTSILRRIAADTRCATDDTSMEEGSQPAAFVPSTLDHYSALLQLLRDELRRRGDGGNSGAPTKPMGHLAASAYLLQMCAKRLPKQQLAELFEESWCEAINPAFELLLLQGVGDNDTTSLANSTALKFLINAGGELLRCPGVTNNESQGQLLIRLVTLALEHPQLVVRAAARKVLRSAFNDPLVCDDGGCHPASTAVADYLHQRLAEISKQHISSVGRGGEDHSTRLFCLLEGMLHRLPAEHFHLLVGDLTSFCAGPARDAAGRCAAFQCLQKALSHQPQALSLHSAGGAELIKTLSAIPPPTDPSVTAYWIRALVEAHVCLSSDERWRPDHRTGDLISGTTQLIAKLFARGGKELCTSLFSSCQRLIQLCFFSSQGECADIAKNFVGHLDEALTVRNVQAWEWILKTMGCLFEECAEAMRSDEGVHKVFQTMAGLRDSDDCTMAGPIDQLFVSAIRHLGLECILTIVPLEIDPDAAVLSSDFKRSWLLPLATQSVHRTSIAYFTRNLLPLATRIHARLPRLANDELKARLYATVEQQLWALLPRVLATQATDFCAGFPPLCPILGAALNERPDLRLTILAAIRAALKHAAGGESETHDEDCAVMERFAKNFLPILFAIYSGQQPSHLPSHPSFSSPSPPPQLPGLGGSAPSAVAGAPLAATSINQPPPPRNGGLHALVGNKVDDKSVRLSTLEAIRLYVPRVSEPLLSTYITSAVEKIKDEEAPLERRAAIMDILIALVRGVHSPQLLSTTVFPHCVEAWLAPPSTDSSTSSSGPKRQQATMQKKAYRLLSELYQRYDEPALWPFFSDNAAFIGTLFKQRNAPAGKHQEDASGDASGTAASARPWRLALYRNLVKVDPRWCSEVLNEVVACLDRDRNSRAGRTQAAKCLQEICTLLVNRAEENGDLAFVALDAILSRILPQPTSAKRHAQAYHSSKQVAATRAALRMARARLIALNIVVQKHVRQMNAALLSKLLSHVVEMIAHKEPSVRILVIRLARIAAGKMQQFALEQYKELLLKASLQQQPIDKHTPLKVRMANALLFDMLLGKFGLDSLLHYAERNPLLVKQLKNLEKARRRRERRKAGELNPARAELPWGVRGKKEEDEEEVASLATAASQFDYSNVLGAKTAHVDSIFELLGESDQDEEAEDDERRSRFTRNKAKSVIVSERAGEDPLNLLDREATLGRMVSTDSEHTGRSGRMTKKRQQQKDGNEPLQTASSPILTNAEGKLVIADLEREEKRAEKRRKKQLRSEKGKAKGQLAEEEPDEEEWQDGEADEDDEDEEWMGAEVKKRRKEMERIAQVKHCTQRA